MAQYQLPNDFFFGAAMSGPQTEGQWNQGGKLENLWDTWSIQDLGSFYNCVGSYAGNDFMAKYQEDFRILKDLGLNTYRTSIQWSRLLDADGNLNEEGAAWYHELFRASREAGLEPFVNLYHFDMPTYLFNRGGWESREVVEAYASIYSFIREQCGLKISSFHRTIRAVAATEEEAERLDTKPGSPLLELTQIGFLDSGATFEYSISRNVGDRFELHNVTLA